VIRLLGALLLAAALTAAAAPAPAADDHDFTAEVTGLPGKTWIDLLSQIFPDIAPSSLDYATASKLIDLRSIGAGDDSWVQCGDTIRFQDRDVRPVRLAGRNYFIVTVMIEDDCVGPLALFDATGKLVDAVNVKGDQHVSFAGDYVRQLGADGALVIASLWHDNSSQSYDISSLVLATPKGFASIGDILALGSHECGDGETHKPGELLQEESIVRVVPNGDPLARIEAEVKRTVQKLDPEDWETTIGRPVRTSFSGYWRWNAAKKAYDAHIMELGVLADWTEKHF